MTEESEPAASTKPLPEHEAERVALLVDGYGLASIAQTLRDICAKKAAKYGPDVTRLTAEQKRHEKLWRFGKEAYQRCLQALLDHGPESGCK